MKLPVFVVPCHVFSVPFCCARGLQHICVYGCCAVVDSAKSSREKEKADIKGRERNRLGEKKGQREMEEGSYLRCSLPTSH